MLLGTVNTCLHDEVSVSATNGNIILLTKENLDSQKAQDIVSTPQSGAISIFIGTTRDIFEGKQVLKLEYECYEEMAYKELAKICQKMRRQWTLNKICILHRLGEVPIQEASVIVAVSACHRREAIDAASFCIDALKDTVPIWKKVSCCYVVIARFGAFHLFHYGVELRNGDLWDQMAHVDSYYLPLHCCRLSAAKLQGISNKLKLFYI